jgi:hypothetical protein
MNKKIGKIKFDATNRSKKRHRETLNTMSSIVTPSNFNTKNIAIAAPRTLQSGAKQAYINYGGERFIMQTAIAMTVPFGLNIADKYGPAEYSVDLSFRGSDQRPEIKEFLAVMTQIDEYMIQKGVENSVAWFKSKLSEDVIRAFYTPCVKYSKDKEGNIQNYPPNLKVKLRKINNEFETKFYDLNGSPYKNIPVEELLVKGVQTTAIIECGGVWFAGSKFGLTWRAKQIAIHKLPERINDFAFKGLSAAAKAVADAQEEAEDEEEESADNEIDDDAAFKGAKPSAVAAVMPQASVDDEEGDDVEPVPAPKKTVIKKKVIAKGK